MIDDNECPTCRRGHAFSDAVFHEGERQIRWTMWTCGHSARMVGETKRAGAPVPSATRPIQARA
jgi:hypothetical protein